jgi:hypothetical protein
MQCFYHIDKQAVGLCKYCARGICSGCAAEREGGLACKERCEEMVDRITDLVKRNVRISAGSGSTSLLAVVVYWGAALVCSFLLIRETQDTMRLLFGVMAGVMFVSAVANTRILFSRRGRDTSNISKK